MISHTPGPWKVNIPYAQEILITVNGNSIATVHNVSPFKEEATAERAVETVANAHLIAKACYIPEMLELLEDLKWEIDNYVTIGGPDDSEKIGDVIKKVKGYKNEH